MVARCVSGAGNRRTASPEVKIVLQKPLSLIRDLNRKYSRVPHGLMHLRSSGILTNKTECWDASTQEVQRHCLHKDPVTER